MMRLLTLPPKDKDGKTPRLVIMGYCQCHRVGDYHKMRHLDDCTVFGGSCYALLLSLHSHVF